jgi:transcriptional regulator with XRE-family HTH domain
VVEGLGREAELGRFLRARRMRLKPEDVGLPSAGRRRTPGLRREEVSVLAGVSVTWYTYLEQGRGKDVSPAVIDSIARVLQLTEDERRHLHVLAHGRAVTRPPLAGDLPGDELVKLLVRSVGQCPYPVYGANLYCDLIAWNQAAAEWYDDWGKLPGHERNMLRWLITSSTARERIEGWERDVRDIIARWRAMSSAWLADNRVQNLIAEFRSISADFARFWDEHEVLEHRSRPREFRHPRLGQQRMRLIVVESPEFTPSFVVFHAPES